MADSTINALTALDTLDHTNDEFAVWDDSASTTKKIAASLLTGGVVNALDYCTGDGVADDTTGFQSAVDAAIDGVLVLPAGTTYLITGTIYVGDCIIKGGGRDNTKISLLGDASWADTGTGTLRIQGAILTKAAAAAGYGLSTCSLGIESLEIELTRSNAAGPESALLLEYVDGGYIRDVLIDSVSTAQEMNVFDMYRGCKNFHLSNCTINNNSTASAGGIWIRNFDTSNVCENILVENCTMTSTAGDEALSVYHPNSPNDGVMRNIKVTNCTLRNTSTTGGKVFSMLNNGNKDPDDFSVEASNLHIEIDVVPNNGFAVQLDDAGGCALRDSTVVVNDVAAGATISFGVRGPTAPTGSKILPLCDNVTIIANGLATDKSLYGFGDYLNLQNCSTDVLGAGEFITPLLRVKRVHGGTFKGAASQLALDCVEIVGARFHHSNDLSGIASLIQVNSAPTRDYVYFDRITVEVTGTGATNVWRLFDFAAASDYAIHVGYCYVNGTKTDNMAASPADTVHATPQVVQWDGVIYNNNVDARSKNTQTIDVT